MAQVSFGTITITDTNDIESITIEYARNQSTSTAPTSGWSTTRPDWAQGYYIWQRARIHKSGTESSSDTFGTAVCLTGSTGSTGATGRGISSIATSYCNYGTGTPAASYSGWQSTVPAYDSTKPNYWVKTVITYTTGSPATDTSIYKDNGITDAVTTSAEANATATDAWNKADDAQDDAAEALALAQNTNYAWWSLATAKTVGQNTFAAGSYGTFIRSTDFQNNPANQPNIFVDANGLHLRRALTDLASFTGTALTFNNPSTGNAQLVIGASGSLQSGDFSITNNTDTFSSLGTKVDLTYGEIYTPYFRVSQGSITGGPAAGVYITGNFESTTAKIGNTKQWDIKTFRDSQQINFASITGTNKSFIQLGANNTWFLGTDKIHTAWYVSGNYLSYPLLNSKYYDFGMNLPSTLSDKFLYIRYNTSSDLSTIYQNDSDWVYTFWIDGEGKVHAPGFYIGNSTTPIGGGAGTIAEKLLNGAGSATQPVYFRSDSGHVGEVATTTYQLNAAGAKGVVTDIANNSSSTDLPTTAAVVTYVTGRGYKTTDENVKTTSASNSSTFYIAGPTTTSTTTGTLKVIADASITVNGSGKATITATTFSGNLSGTASRATADSDGNTIKTTYLKLSGGSVTGPVSFGDSVTMDEATIGDLVVSGGASFTNNLQANTINGVAVGNSPKFTDTNTEVSTFTLASGTTAGTSLSHGGKYTLTAGSKTVSFTMPSDNNTTYTFASGTNGFTVTPSGGSAQTVTVTPSITNNVTGSGTSGYLTKWNGTNTITNGPQLGSSTTTFLRNDGTWATPIGSTYSAGSGLRLSGSQFINTRIPFVVGTQTAATGTWTGVCNDITALYDGLTIAYWLPYAGSGNATLNLTINGTATGAKNCYYGGTTRLTTHYGAGNIIYLTYHSAANVNGTAYEGWWAQGQYYSDSQGYSLRRTYSCVKAGANKVFPYTLIMELPNGRWESIVTSSSTGTSKACNTHGFLPGQVLLMYQNSTYNENAVLDTYRLWTQNGVIDHRYSFNTANDSTNGTVANKPIYLVGTITNGLFYLDTTKWWTQNLPSSADGKVYIYLGDAYDYYRMQFNAERPIYHYTNGQIRQYGHDAATINGLTVGKSVPSDAVFTDTHHTAYLYDTTSSGTSSVTSDTTDPYLTLVENGSARSRVQLKAGTNMTSITAKNGVITFVAKDTTYTAASSVTAVGTTSVVGTSPNYARQDHIHNITLATGDANGQVKIAGTNISVKGLGSWAYKSSGTASDVGLSNVSNYAQITKIGDSGDGKLRVWTGDPDGNGYTDVTVHITAYDQSTVSKAEALDLAAAVGTNKKPVYFKADGTPCAIDHTIETNVPANALFTDHTYEFADSYNASTNKGATVATVTNAINALDGGTIGTPGTGKTITAISQSNGNISVTFGNISITKSQISDFPSELTPSSHSHGNITDGGDITATAPTIASGDQIIINDHSASKITNGPTFDGSTTTKALTPKGTWETFNNYSLPLAANGTRGGVQIGYSGSGKNYAVQLSNEKMYVNVPWENTTYSAGTGLSLSGTTFSNTGVLSITTTEGSHTTISSGTGAISFGVPTKTSHLTNDSGFLTNSTLYEANLQWGGKDFSASYGPIDAAMIDVLGANRFAFLKAAGLTIEYSTNGGSSWTDYGATDAQKVGLFSSGQSFYLGKHTTNGSCTTNDQLRVTIATGTASIYTVLNKIAIYMSTSGATVQVLIEKALESTPTTFITHKDWTGISGWSGWNILNISGLTTYGNTAASQYGRIRFTFKQTAVNTNYTSANISKIMGFGGVGWTTPSNMAATGHLYSYDSSQNATFPAKVTASGGFSGSLTGNASSATEFNSNATVTLTGDVTGTSAGSKKSWSVATTIGEGKVTNAMLAGSIANGKLANSSITINGSAISLGGSVSVGTVTKVTAGTGLSIGSTAQGNFTTTGTINHTNSVTAKTAAAQSAKTLTWGGTFTIYEEKYDAQGHITGVASYNMTMPSNPNSDTKVKLTSQSTSGTYPLTFGPTSITSGSAYEIFYNTGITVNPSTGLMNTTIYQTGGHGQMKYDSTLEAIVFNFV